MDEISGAGIRLELSSGHPPVTDLAEINERLHAVGFRIWPLNLSTAPAALQQLLSRPTLSDAEVASVQQHFLLSRQRMLELIREAGRTPQVPGGGEMSTFDSTNGVTYPQLYIIGAGVDYTRFDRFHMNSTGEGAGIDEVMQVLHGAGVRILQHLPEEGAFTVVIDCVANERGWIVTYDGGRPHIGSFSEGQPGTKVLVQAIGPARWEVSYVDG